MAQDVGSGKVDQRDEEGRDRELAQQHGAASRPEHRVSAEEAAEELGGDEGSTDHDDERYEHQQ
jgi:hypothetical protein